MDWLLFYLKASAIAIIAFVALGLLAVWFSRNGKDEPWA